MRSASAGRFRSASRSTCPRSGAKDEERRAKAKIPAEVSFKTKPELGGELIEQAAGWEIPKRPVLGDAAYGDNTKLRERLDGAECEYVLAVSAETAVFAPETAFAAPEREGATGRPRGRLRPDRKPLPIAELIAALDDDEWQTVAFRDGPEDEPISSRFALARVRAAHLWQRGFKQQPRQEWLICEWPEGAEQPTDYWLSNLSTDVGPERLARLRWKIELDYQAAQGRARPPPLRGPLMAWLAPSHRARHRRPWIPHPRAASSFSPAAGLTPPQAVLRLQPGFKCWAGRCQVCQQPTNLDHPSLQPARQNE